MTRSVLGPMLLVPALLGLCACRRVAPASVPIVKPPSESVLGRVTLSAEAEKRLGIVPGLTPLSAKPNIARRLLRGEVMPAPGNAVWVTAPHAGVLQRLPSAPQLQAGTRVQAGQPLALLTASLGPTERLQVSTVRVDADAQLTRAQVQDQATELALRRAERLLADEVAGTKLLDEAKAQRETARAALHAATAQHAALVGGSGQRGALAGTLLEAPLAGVLREVRVAPRQLVVAGTQLFEVASEDPPWVRVAVPSGELSALSPGVVAYVDDWIASRTETPAAALPVESAPRTAQPLQGTVDRYFALTDRSRFQLGQTVAVWLGLRADLESPALPAAALLYDPSGGTWVYERTAEQVFVRRRVEVVRIEAERAILSPRSLQPSGLHLGAAIVTAGAMELYGAEFGSGK